MKLTALIILSFVCNSAWASDIVFSKPIQQVTNKTGLFCAITVDGLKCWDAEPRDQYPILGDHLLHRIPPLKNPQQVVMTFDQVCALDDEGIKCWGADRREYPKFNNPTQITLTYDLLCSTVAEGVKCAGPIAQNQNFWESVKNPLQVETSALNSEDYVVCIRNSQEVLCWEYNSHRAELKPINGPVLRNPHHMSVGWQICAIDDDGLKCWGIPGERWDSSPKEDKIRAQNPLQVTSGELTCVLEATGVQCWNKDTLDLVSLPPLKNPFQVYSQVGHGSTCAIDDEGIKCWDETGESVSDFPPLNFISINTLKGSASPARAQYLTPMSELSSRSDRNLQENFLLWALISPSVLSVDSNYYSEKLIPAYRLHLNNIGAALSYESRDAGLQKTPDTSIARMIALESIRSALAVASEFLSKDQHEQLQNALRATGVALSNPMNNQKILDLVKQMDALSVEKQKLRTSSKSAFLGDTLELAANWLREKVK
jgi:hypothetical protein